MRHRFAFEATALTLPVLVWCLTAPPLISQTVSTGRVGADPKQNDSGQTWTPPRTSWGHPDLQGVWSYASLTPLQRPAGLGDKEFFTPEEAAERNAGATAERPLVPGVIGSYNSHWFDKGKVDPSRRTSLIVDPPSGRLPPMTAQGKARVRARSQRVSGRPDSWLNFRAWVRCITYHGVPPVSTGYNNTYQILQTPDHVAILVENIHDVRIIPLDGKFRIEKKCVARGPSAHLALHFVSIRQSARSSTRGYASGTGIRAVIGKATPWLLRRPISATRPSIDSRPRRTSARRRAIHPRG